MPNGDSGDGGNGPDSAVLYMRSMADELAKMAQQRGLDGLAYLFEMARLEADRLTHRNDDQTSDTLPPP
ncbi:MAG TPA: hypothetical protein VH206_17015 [Xanthobacteraceae bacterium]|jgi:hypothetical protein|nr:hypothetical protein [Xanthobacteraceae bacterium]